MTFEKLLDYTSKEHPNVCIDSRMVKPGDIFVAIDGNNVNGHDFIPQALENGAKFVVSQELCNCKGAYEILVPDTSRAAAILAQTSRGNPASSLTNLAVTGTKGKTTVTFLVRSCVEAAGQKSGIIGTVICDTGAEIFDSTMTTPDCLTIARLQQQMVGAGTKYMVLEASSHAIFQNRLAGIDFKAAAFTNLSGDHMDYHKTHDDYLAAKSLLFEGLSADATAVLNKESPEAAAIAGKTRAKILWYAIDKPADLVAHIESMDSTGTAFTLEYAGRKEKISTPLLGCFNVSNSLAAAGLCLAAGLELKIVAKGLSNIKTIPGRLDRIDWQGPFDIFVDYAHTDDALKNVLVTLKPLCKSKLITVFGCGGDRDRTKRPRMARVAEELADFVIVTSDNPRTEKPEDIIEEVVGGFKNPNAPTIKIEPDRKKAIESAVKSAAPNDIVLIAGKGHETYQIIGKTKYDFNDKLVARQFLEQL